MVSIDLVINLEITIDEKIVKLLVFTEILQVIPLLKAVSVSMADTPLQITSPLNPEKPQYNQVSTMLTLK